MDRDRFSQLRSWGQRELKPIRSKQESGGWGGGGLAEAVPKTGLGMGQKLSLMTKKVGRGSRDCPDSCEVGGGGSPTTHTHTHTHTKINKSGFGFAATFSADSSLTRFCAVHFLCNGLKIKINLSLF